jgi:hypothetical protein
MIKSIIAGACVALFSIAQASAESPYPRPTRDGRETIARDGGRACPTGYIGKGDKCEALHQDTPRAYPVIPGKACPSGTFRSGDACKEFR